MKGYFTLACISWASLIALIWLLILGIVPYGNIQFWALIFFFVVALLCSFGARGDEVKQDRLRDRLPKLTQEEALAIVNQALKMDWAEKEKDGINEIVRSSGAK